MAAITGMVLAGCPNPSGRNGENENNGEPQTATYISTDSAGNRYTLEIIENTGRAARYAVQTGDRFILTIELFKNETYSLALTCSGTVDSAQNTGTVIRLSLSVNGEPLNITISGTAMTVITGSIMLDNGETITAPDEVTPVVPDAPVAADVYVAGSYGAGIPCYWKNGVKTDLPLAEGEYRGSADKIIVDGTDIYILGTVDNGSRSLGCYWKNGALSVLLNSGYATDFAVSNADMYIVGHYQPSSDVSAIPCYWRNGIKTDLAIGPGGTQGVARAIAVSGSTVFIAGDYYVPRDDYGNYIDIQRGCYWINGARTDLPGEDYYYVESIAVNGSDIFLTGWFAAVNPRHSWLYKNGNTSILPSGSTQDSAAHDITIYNNDAYIAGFSGNGSTRQASYWKNFTLNMLSGTSPGKDSFAYGITVVNGDIYVAGQVNVFFDFQDGNSSSTACYWKNGARVDLLDNAGASGIFVVAAKE
jgi:hypothetical protein